MKFIIKYINKFIFRLFSKKIKFLLCEIFLMIMILLSIIFYAYYLKFNRVVVVSESVLHCTELFCLPRFIAYLTFYE